MKAVTEYSEKQTGVTVTDKHPNGCVGCHKAIGDKDYRLKMGLANGQNQGAYRDGHHRQESAPGLSEMPSGRLLCRIFG